MSRHHRPRLGGAHFPYSAQESAALQQAGAHGIAAPSPGDSSPLEHYRRWLEKVVAARVPVTSPAIAAQHRRNAQLLGGRWG